MTPEEYQKVKEAEKAHLRKLKELKKTHAQLSRKARITNAVTDMAESVQELYDEHQTMVDRLEMDAISSEARLDVAMDGLEGDSSTQEALDAAQLEADQKAIKKARAKALIEQMKLETGSAPASPTKSESPSAKAGEANPDAGETAPDLPEKTIGKMKP